MSVRGKHTMKKTLFMFVAVAITIGASMANAQGPIVMQNCGNADIGNTNIFVVPAVIIWNPCLAAQADSISPGTSQFFFAHEMCHASLRTANEAAADICAAQNVGPAAAAAAVRYFLIIAPSYPYLPQYGTAYDRARRIAAGAGLPSPI
jgi:hypothetical protein